LLLWFAALTAIDVQAAEVIWNGHYRTRALGFDSLSLSPDHDLSENLALGLDHKLQLRPTWAITGNVALHAQLDLLAGSGWGSTTDTWTDSVSGEAIDATSADGVTAGDSANTSMTNINVRRLWGDVYTQYGRLRVGRMPLEWGAGMLFNPGLDPNSDYGDTTDRIQFTTRLAGVYLVGAWDLIQEGYLNTNDDIQAANLALAYRTETVSAGFLNRYKFRTDPGFRSYTGDVWANAQLGPVHVETEIALVLGSGALSEEVDEVDISAFGALLELGGSIQEYNVGLQFGIASGDEDPTDKDLNTFHFDREHNVGLLMFEEALPTLSAETPNSTNSGREYGAARTGDGVSNAQYVKPSLGYSPNERVTLTLSALLARAAKLPAAEEADRGYGTEYDLAVRWNPYDKVWVDATAAVFTPGPYYSNYTDPDFGGGYEGTAFGGQLLATVEF